jgi:hypothetical protein
MLKRLRSALQAARVEYRIYPERVKRKEEELLTETVGEVLHQLSRSINDTTMSFVKRFMRNPSADEISTFLEAVSPLPPVHQIALFKVVNRNTDGHWVKWPAVQKWALKHSAAMASAFLK